MVTPVSATVILIVLCVFLLVVVPMLEASERFGKYVSLRYTLVVVFSLLAVGCVLDFSHLTDDTRNYIIMGAAALIGLFVLVRSLEKMRLGGKTIEFEAHKGDLGASAKIRDKEDKP